VPDSRLELRNPWLVLPACSNDQPALCDSTSNMFPVLERINDPITSIADSAITHPSVTAMTGHI
jgi:hypothetical protein